MGVRHSLMLLPCLAASLARAQTGEALASETSTAAPVYTPEQCDGWIDALLSSDADVSNGASVEEYFSFLSSIVDPPYIAEYFGRYDSFDQLPWAFRVVHKSLACQCQNLGLGEKCCEGENAEVLLPGSELSPTLRTSAGAEYRDLFCQQISFVLTKAISSPAPTADPSVGPTGLPIANPSVAPSSDTRTASPVKAPTNFPAAEPVVAPTIPETPTLVDLIANLTEPEVFPEVRGEGGDEGGLGTGAIVAICIGVGAVIIVAIALWAIHRQREEEAEVREFAGDEVLEAEM